MEKLVDKYRRLCCLNKQELLRLHKLYCLTQHPLWKQISAKFWKDLLKYWNPDLQTVNKDEWEFLVKALEKKILKVMPLCSFPSLSEISMIALLDYYLTPYYYQSGTIDISSFSVILSFHLSKFIPVLSMSSLSILAISCFESIELDTDLPSSLSLFINTPQQIDLELKQWLHINFAKMPDQIQSTMKALHFLYPDSTYKFSAFNLKTSKFIDFCKQTFESLIKLKNSECKRKNVFLSRTPEKKNSNKKIPIEGKSIYIPKSSKCILVKTVILDCKQKKNAENSVSIIEKYRESCNATPEPLSPRIFHEESQRENRVKLIDIQDLLRNKGYKTARSDRLNNSHRESRRVIFNKKRIINR